MFNLFLQNKEISWYFYCRWVQNKRRGCITFIWKVCFSLQCYTNTSPLFSEASFFSTDVRTWRARVLIPAIAPSAIVFLFHMHTKDDKTIHAKIFWCWNWAQLPFCSAPLHPRRALPKLNKVFIRGAELIQPSNHRLRAGHLFRRVLPVSLMSTWASAWAGADHVNGRPQLSLPLQTRTWALAEPYWAE